MHATLCMQNVASVNTDERSAESSQTCVVQNIARHGFIINKHIAYYRLGRLVTKFSLIKKCFKLTVTYDLDKIFSDKKVF